jgi:hypothetical protein
LLKEFIMSDWYYQKSGVQFGAISGAELKSLADAGQLLPTDLVRKQGHTSWRPASEVKGLYACPDSATKHVRSLTPVSSSLAKKGRSGGWRCVLHVLSFMVALGSIFVGGASIAAFWTPFDGWTIPLAMVALVTGTLTLLVDWFRDVPRFSVSVMGVATGTLAMCFAFVHQGGLDFKRYVPIVLTAETKNEATIAIDPTPLATKEIQGADLQGGPEPLLDARTLRARNGMSVISDSQVQTEVISSTPAAASGIVVTPLNLDGFPTIASAFLCTPGKGPVHGRVQETHSIGEVMPIRPGTYDLWYTTKSTGTILILKDFEVPAKSKVTVQSDRLVSAIVVNDLALGVKARRISIVHPGGNQTFNEIALGAGGFGEPILVTAGREYDVIVTPEGGEPVVVAERVQPRVGEILIVSGSACTEQPETTQPSRSRILGGIRRIP